MWNVLRLEPDGRPLEGNTVPLERAFIKHRVRVIMGTGRQGDTASSPA